MKKMSNIRTEYIVKTVEFMIRKERQKEFGSWIRKKRS